MCLFKLAKNVFARSKVEVRLVTEQPTMLSTTHHKFFMGCGASADRKSEVNDGQSTQDKSV